MTHPSKNRRDYDVDNVIYDLMKKGVFIDRIISEIDVSKAIKVPGRLGNKTWGMIEFLINKHKFHVVGRGTENEG